MRISEWFRRQLVLVLSTALAVLLAACGANPLVIGTNAGSTSPKGAGTTSPPTVSSVSVSSAPSGDAYMMTINGTNFTTDATTKLGATPLATTYVSAAVLTATVPADLVALVSTASVLVSTPNGTSSSDSTLAVTPAPTVGSLGPSSTIAGGAGFTLTIGGTNFAANSVANWGATPLTTTYISSTRLTAAVPASLIAVAGAASVTVTTINGSSTGVTFAITQPAPVISSLSPATIIAGSAAFTLTINGSNFLPGSGTVVKWNYNPLPTTYVSSVQLTATIPANYITGTATLNVGVVTVAGSSSNLQFTIAPAVPVINGLGINQLPAGFGTFVMTVYGTHFTTTSTVNWGATPFLATSIGSGTLSFVVPGNLVANVGTVQITVTTAGGTSAPVVFTIFVPQPQITSLVPTSIAAGSAGVTIIVNGANFTPLSQIYFWSTHMQTNHISGTQMSILVPASLIAVAGTAGVEVYTPGSSGWSMVSNFTVVPASPAITSLSPTSVTAGYAGFMLTVNGTALTPTSICMWGATPLGTVYVSPTQLLAIIPASLIMDAGTASISIANVTGTSAVSILTINQALPQINNLNPGMLTAGGSGFQLAISGAYFTPTSTSKWGSTPLTTTYINSTQLTAVVPASLIATAGTVKVTVATTAGTSPPATVSINPPPRILTTTMPSGTAGVAYSGTINVTDGVPGYNWVVTGLPSSLSFNNTNDSDLVITGKPVTAGVITIQVSAEDTAGTIAGPVTLTINIGNGPTGANNGKLEGRYECLLHGFFDDDTSRWASLLSIQVDGQGNIPSGIVDTNSHEVGSASGIVTGGSYTLDADYNGLASIETRLTEGAAGIQTTVWAIEAAAGTQPIQHFRMVEADDLGSLPSSQHGTGDCFLATTSAFTASTLAGSSFVFGLDGESNSGTLKATTGVVTTLSGQRVSGYVDMARGGSTTVQSFAIAGSYTVPEAATGRAQLLLGYSNYPSGFTVYIIDTNRMLILDNSSNNGEQAGNMRRQQQATYSIANVNGPFVFYTRGAKFNGVGNTPSGYYANLFEGTADGSGSLIVQHNYGNDGGAYSAANSSGSPMALTFDSHYSGRTRFASTNGTTYLYLFDQNSGFAMNVQNDGSLDTGRLENQTQTTFTNGALAGDYLFGELPVLDLQSNGNIGEYDATTSGTIGGTLTTAGDGNLSWDQALNATYSWDATAAGTGSFLIANGAQGASSCTVVSATKFVCVSQGGASPSVEVMER